MKFVPGAITRKLNRQILLAQKNSPKILFGAGVVGTVGTVVLACRATLKLEEVLDEAKDRLDDVNSLQHDEYSESDRRSDRTIVTVQTSLKLAKLYAPSVALGVVSIACLTKSHQILSERNVALTAAYSGLAHAFSEYRQNVADDLGVEKEAEYYHGVVEEKVRTEDGKKVTVKRGGDRAPYSRIFDHLNSNWQNNPEYNGYFLKSQQEYANHRLRAKGHLFLNDVLNSLGFEETSAGAVTGWLWNQDNGDDFVDFGVGDWPSATDFVHGKEGAILLNFNVDGIIYDKI